MASNNEQMDVYTQIIIIVVVLVALYLVWHMFGHYVVNTASLVATALIHAANFVFKQLPENKAVQYIYFLFVDEVFIYETEKVLSRIKILNSMRPSLDDAQAIFYIIGYFFRFPIFFLSLWGAYLCFKLSKPSRMKRKFDIFSLAEYAQEYFPQIRPALRAKLAKTNFDEGAFRQEASPIRFAILNGALTYVSSDGVEYKVVFGKKLHYNNKKQILTIIDSYDIDEGLPILHRKSKIDLNIIRKRFVNQITKLGRWESSDQLPPQIKALFAVFLLMIKGGKSNKEKAFKLLDQFSATFCSTKVLKENLMFDNNGVDEVIEKYSNQVAVKKIMHQHTYTVSVLNALYHRATHRRSKLPPSRFLWLKEYDRGTWYALHHNLSPGAWTESAGPRGILLTENKLGKRANYPFSDNAIEGYLKFINNEGWLLQQPEFNYEVSTS